MGAPAGRTVLGCREPYRLLRADALAVLDPLRDRFGEGFQAADIQSAKPFLTPSAGAAATR
jgi:hypothetical protein